MSSPEVSSAVLGQDHRVQHMMNLLAIVHQVLERKVLERQVGVNTPKTRTPSRVKRASGNSILMADKMHLVITHLLAGPNKGEVLIGNNLAVC